MNQQLDLPKIAQGIGLVVLLWLVLVAVDGWIRPLLPSNELHHASIAWEMYQHHQFLVPVQTGLPYAEKTPLLYWLIHVGWFLFGVSTIWIRLLPQLFMLGSLLLTRYLAQCLTSTEENIIARRMVPTLAPLILLGFIAWSLQMHITWFDMMIIFFSLLCWCTLYLAVQCGGAYWWILGLAMGGGVLVKGPVILLFALPPAIFMRWWAPQPRQYCRQSYWRCVQAVLLAIVIGLSWSVPAAVHGGGQYAHNLFLTQSVGRVAGRHGPVEPWYFYLQNLPLLLLPWILWLQPWRTAYSCYRGWQQHNHTVLRFLTISIIGPVLVLSLFATKSSGYLFPCLPLAAIFLAYLLALGSPTSCLRDRWLLAIFYSAIGLSYLLIPCLVSQKMQQHFFWLPELSPVWGLGLLSLGIFWLIWTEQRITHVAVAVTITSILFCIFFQVGVNRVIAAHNDWRPLALQIRKLQDAHIAVAFPRYGSEELFEFLGRLQQPIVIHSAEISQWRKDHPDGWFVKRSSGISPAQYYLSPVNAQDSGFEGIIAAAKSDG